MKKKYFLSFVIILIIAITFFIYRSFSNKDDGLVEGIVSGNGRIEAEQVDIMAKSSGRLAEVLVKEGDTVSAGQVLARIDTSELQVERGKYLADQAAALASAEEAQATISQRQAELVLKRANRDRVLAIALTGSISQQTRDEALSEQDVARATLQAARKNAASGMRSVEAAKAQVRQIDVQIAEATLVAPADGRVLYRLARTGEIVSSGGKVLTIVDLSDVYMEIYLAASDASRIALGSEARIRIDGADTAIPATVSFVSPEAQFTPKQVETQSEREKLVFRVKLRLLQSYVKSHMAQIKTGMRGMGYVRLEPDPPAWPKFLQIQRNGDPADAKD